MNQTSGVTPTTQRAKIAEWLYRFVHGSDEYAFEDESPERQERWCKNADELLSVLSGSASSDLVRRCQTLLVPDASSRPNFRWRDVQSLLTDVVDALLSTEGPPFLREPTTQRAESNVQELTSELKTCAEGLRFDVESRGSLEYTPQCISNIASLIERVVSLIDPEGDDYLYLLGRTMRERDAAEQPPFLRDLGELVNDLITNADLCDSGTDDDLPRGEIAHLMRRAASVLNSGEHSVQGSRDHDSIRFEGDTLESSRRDTQRLDWLELHGGRCDSLPDDKGVKYAVWDGEADDWSYAPNLREAIDAAMSAHSSEGQQPER